MNELAAKIQLYNNRLRERRTRLGMTPRQVAEAAGVPYQVYLDYEALRRCPCLKRFNGQAWTPTALRLAEYYRVTEEELFPQAVLAVETRQIERTFDAEQVYALSTVERPALPDRIAEESELKRDIVAALSQFTPREQDIIRRRFMEGDSVEEIAAVYDLSRGRVQQIEAKVLRRLRSPTGGLRSYA